MNYDRPSIAAKKLGVSTKTLERWADAGQIDFYLTKGGQRRYNTASITSKQERVILLYARVSSRKQRSDLERQIEFLESYYPGAEVVSDIGSGLNYNRQGLKALLERVFAGDVRMVVVCHKDRLCRFGAELISWIADHFNCKLVVFNQASLSPEREMVEDILAIVHVFSCRLYGLRKYKNKIKDDSELPSLPKQRT
jgi:excisionase family DNA binding protein